jgi:outer membrane lipoprotein-sorting protein
MCLIDLRGNMIRITMLVLCLLGAASCATQTLAQQPATLSPQSSVDEILDAMDARGQGLKSFTADVKLGETDSATGDESTRSGKVWYQVQDNGSARIRVTFETRQANGKIANDKIEYLLSGTDLIDRTYRTRTQVTRQIFKPGQKVNLFKLGEGPFPLPIGQKKQDVFAQFDVKKIEPKKEDPADTAHVQLIPKPDTRLERRFKSIDVWVGTKDQMPHRIETLDKTESSTRTTELTNVQVNTPLADSSFKLPDIDKDNWQLREEAYND